MWFKKTCTSVIYGFRKEGGISLNILLTLYHKPNDFF